MKAVSGRCSAVGEKRTKGCAFADLRPPPAGRCFLVACFALIMLSSCKREERGFRVQPAAASRTDSVTLTELRPGESQPPPSASVRNEYEENAYAMNEGKRLYEWMNCVGCHAHGGGGMGPALMDDRWIYGGQPEQVFATIVQGRPNGMPSFRGRIPDYQVWQLAAYVRSMSGQVPSDAAPGRSDDIHAKEPEQSKEKEQPKK
ncbi:MAG TPA: c-type cytochrome [Pyrinomonadaceae bacterium]|jgi:cytochrome c oxidase cbb3-type subunit 3|nr:c-type cytochrome [Pyrinomonadaceae bacterium]